MPLLDKKYEQLALTDQYITDPLLMALAWKKAHHYIRTTNWYADNFELDFSALNLAKLCEDWKHELAKIKFEKLELIPAPKTQQWGFYQEQSASEENQPTEGVAKRFADMGFLGFELDEHIFCRTEWMPKNAQELKLRPLAHIGIKEQTIMTLVMMCLANEVEAQQGDPAADYKEVHEKKVVSYGNRLYCTYSEDGKAEHNYGATTLYGKYFTDYRKFLQRPYYFAHESLSEISSDQEVYLVDLDLKKFFDCISRAKLIAKICQIAKDQKNLSKNTSPTVKHILSAFDGWEWSKRSLKDFPLCKGNQEKEGAEPPKGLPQGLVAAGFFANIYMLEFDEWIAKQIDCLIDDAETDLKLVDYCRYVDDMRLVLIGPSRKNSINQDPTPTIKKRLGAWLKSELDQLGLELHPEKTKVEIYRGKAKGVSATLEEIQSKTSGPVSHEDAGELLGQLESLLILSTHNFPDQDGERKCRPNRLEQIEKSTFDVRDDTLKRFAANKISTMLNSMRHFTAREIDSDGQAILGDWDYLQERMARRLIACWSRDPALVLLLKKGLELFPSTRVLEPVLEQIEYIRNYRNLIGPPSLDDLKQHAVVSYCLSEIFRHSAVVIHRKDPQAIPAQANVDAFFERLQNFAAELIDKQSTMSKQGEFDLLISQARFLILIRLDTLLEKSTGDNKQDLIFKLTKGYRNITVSDELDQEKIATCILLASQLVTNIKPLTRATCCLLNQPSVNAKSILEKLAIQDKSLVILIILHARTLQYDWYKEEKNKKSIRELAEKLYIDIKPSAKPLEKIKTPTALLKLVLRTDNPFANEIMVIKLMLALLNKADEFKIKGQGKTLDLNQTKVLFEGGGYHNPPEFDDFARRLIIHDIAFQSPISPVARHLLKINSEDMCQQDEAAQQEAAILQKVALCIRAALAGSDDPTGFGVSSTPRAGYRGLKSTQFKRQLGLYTTPESLAGESAAFSSWITTLVSKLLKWPGIHINDQGFLWPYEMTLGAVQKLLEDRLKELKKIYCKLSAIPGLSEKITPDWSKDKTNLTVVMVQSKLPKKKDFAENGLLLDNPQYRTKHRRHIARVAKLIIQHLEAQHLEKPKNGVREHHVDLIVWPELAVHQDDRDILIQLSRKTHSIVFAGLGFMHQPKVKGPNNCALWIVPRKHNGNKNEILRLQGKQNMMADETGKVIPWRPYQLMLELRHPQFPSELGFILTGAICFDATDIALSADLRDKSNTFLIPSLNQDVNSFDTMVDALHYHMFQHVVLVNTGEFGSSYAKAPYKDAHKRLIAHSSGNNQVAINSFDLNMFDFRRDQVGTDLRSKLEIKAAPAGVSHKC
ncbi:MAG: hypothetical protein IBX50_17480 [Marinospirillum sp.]|uniref:reverse transcriptase domain-containing protein n=1 Tax=Marinospirillum sp. TaxID=2183934 RepID=UPI0019DDDE94|nr:reverse transcriptase domain-containing protein [Marinospirillum sp.]MBE0508482.1 hypothetical protein [Marinospirillum sp.]